VGIEAVAMTLSSASVYDNVLSGNGVLNRSSVAGDESASTIL